MPKKGIRQCTLEDALATTNDWFGNGGWRQAERQASVKSVLAYFHRRDMWNLFRLLRDEKRNRDLLCRLADQKDARDGAYRPLTSWEVVDGALQGSIEFPSQFGTVGGPIRVHPTVQANLSLLKCTGAADLAQVAAAVGLAQNLGALRALATEGIQAGHMRMHARTVAATAGASKAEVTWVTERLVQERNYSVERAQALLAELRS